MTADRDPFAAAPPDLRELLALASDLALEAGRIHADGRRQALTIETKSSPTDLVSQVDKAAERLIVDRLRQRTARRRHPRRRGDVARGDERRPLGRRSSGRHDQLHLRLPRLLRLHRGRDRRRGPGRRRPRLELGEAVPGRRRARRRVRRPADHGARARGPGDARSSPPGSRTRRPTASSRARWWPPCCRASATSAAADSAALDLCRLAAGEVDAYWELDLSPWDFAAGVLIAREAGAEVLLAPSAGAGPAVVGTHPSLMPAFSALLREAARLTRDREARRRRRPRRQPRSASRSSGASMTTAAPLSTSSVARAEAPRRRRRGSCRRPWPCACPRASRRGRPPAPAAARTGRRSRARPPGRA